MPRKKGAEPAVRMKRILDKRGKGVAVEEYAFVFEYNLRGVWKDLYPNVKPSFAGNDGSIALRKVIDMGRTLIAGLEQQFNNCMVYDRILEESVGDVKKGFGGVEAVFEGYERNAYEENFLKFREAEIGVINHIIRGVRRMENAYTAGGQKPGGHIVRLHEMLVGVMLCLQLVDATVAARNKGRAGWTYKFVPHWKDDGTAWARKAGYPVAGAAGGFECSVCGSGVEQGFKFCGMCDSRIIWNK